MMNALPWLSYGAAEHAAVAGADGVLVLHVGPQRVCRPVQQQQSAKLKTLTIQMIFQYQFFTVERHSEVFFYLFQFINVINCN